MTELIANSPTPGSRVALTTLATAQSSTTSLTFDMGAAAPSALQGASGDQFRCVIDSEIVIFDAANVSTSTWTALTRGAEGSTKATHASGASVYHDLTAAALQALISGSNPMTTADDMIVGGASGTPARLAIGTDGDVLTVVSGAPTWQAPSTPAPSGPGGTAGANTGSAVTIGDPSTFNQWWGVMNAATVTATTPPPVAGALFQARLDQDATGGRTLAFATNPTFPDYASATEALAAINAHNAASDHVWITFVCVDGTTWEAFPSLAPDTQGVEIISIAYAATMTPALPDGGRNAVYEVGALTAAATIANPTGTPVDGQKIEFRLAEDSTGGYAITWGSEFNRANTALITWPAEPTAASDTWRELFEWNSGTSKWDLLAMV